MEPITGWVPIELKDFSGNGKTDLLWRNVYTGELYVWLLDGPNIWRRGSYDTLPLEEGWMPIGFGDFNGDGKTDLLWRNSNTGGLIIYLLDGISILQVGWLPQVSPYSGWMPIDASDLNGDGRADLLWYNVFTGELHVWLLDGVNLIHYGSLGGTVRPSEGWAPIAIKDFNGDGRADLLLRHAESGQLDVWLLNGSTILHSGSLGTVDPKLGWMPIDASDFNGDGRTDLLWYNSNSGELVVWLLNGSTFLDGGWLGTIPPNDPDLRGWMLIGTDDFNGDGRADLLWLNAFTNATGVWLINGTTVSQVAPYDTIPPSSVWQVQIPAR